MRFALSKLETIRWRPFVTLVCLIAFLVVGLGHAGSHIDSLSGKSGVELALHVGNDGAGDDTQSVAAEICLLCALVAGEFATAPVIAGDVVREVRSPQPPAVHVTWPPAENPPPIA